MEPTLSFTALRTSELAAVLGNPERPSPARARAFLRWLWRSHDPLEPLPPTIDGISKRSVDQLRALHPAPAIQELSRQIASDGTVKLLLSAGGAPVETVIIPGKRRVTVCVSSQSGCTRTCHFCATATMGFHRNLTAGEIVAQVILAKAVAPAKLPLRNIVFMGMGEPMDNLEEVIRAVDVLSTEGGSGLSPAHITVSTSGVIPRMRSFLERSPACLAISLNGTTEEQRREVMPIDRKWPLSQLIDFIREYSKTRLFFVEYILMGGFNDRGEDAQRLVDLMSGLNVRVNLIPFNPHAAARFLRPEAPAVAAFFHILNQHQIRTMIRTARGDDIAAACGQLYRSTQDEIHT